jgi:dTDP-3-amino-3,4,6-trideoxy-alpha-D-glucose transaminase
MSPTISQANPRAEYLACQEEIDAAIRRVLAGGRYVLGEEVAAFEKEFASYLGVSFAMGVASGTDALHLALRACGIGQGDEVVTVSHTAVATVAAIQHCGAMPVLVDVEPATYTLAPETISSAITPRTKAIVPVHLYGFPADMPSILSIARDRGLLVIEDCAQAHGAACRFSPDSEWKKVGSLGHVAAFSFYPTKNLGAVGDGGSVVTNDAAIAEQVRLLREYGWRERYVSSVSGWNSRLDEVQAAILRVKLRALDRWNENRCKIAALYDQRFTGHSIRTPSRLPDRTHVFHQYVVRVKARNQVRQALAQVGIGTGIHYPVPIHRQPAYHHLANSARLKVTEALCADILSLPMYPHLATEAAEKVADQLLLAVAENQ